MKIIHQAAADGAERERAQSEDQAQAHDSERNECSRPFKLCEHRSGAKCRETGAAECRRESRRARAVHRHSLYIEVRATIPRCAAALW